MKTTASSAAVIETLRHTLPGTRGKSQPDEAGEN
jgi:hypothetical protein